MVKIRTILQAAKEIKLNDPKSAVNATLIRRLITTNQIKYTKVGNRYLINPQDIEDYLTGVTNQSDAQNL